MRSLEEIIEAGQPTLINTVKNRKGIIVDIHADEYRQLSWSIHDGVNPRARPIFLDDIPHDVISISFVSANTYVVELHCITLCDL